MGNRYYLTQRGPGPGALPRSGTNLITGVEDFGNRIYVEEINRRAWGYVEYEKPLAIKEINDYELVEQQCKGCYLYIKGKCTRVGTNEEIGICWMELSEGEY